MRKYILTIALLLVPTLCFGWGITTTTGGGTLASVGGSCAYVHCNTLEAQADDDDWTTVGIAPNYDYDFGGFAFEGLECMHMTAGAGASIVVTERAETWITVMFRTNDNNEGTENLIQLYNDGTLLGTLYYDHDNNMKILPAGGSSSA